MADTDTQELLLGRQTPVVDDYSPGLLYPIARSDARHRLGLNAALPFSGADQWHAYEMSWLDTAGKPVAKVGRFTFPADSPNMVESKSFKLYLNSLNNTRLGDDDAARALILGDIGPVAGAEVTLDLFEPMDPALAGQDLAGICLDKLQVEPYGGEPQAAMLRLQSHGRAEESLYSHLLRSLCPVTGQPDWATVWIHYRGTPMDHRSLLQYLVAYRDHQDFHEPCAERMFIDILRRCEPEFLHLQAFYTRRGGLDISPFRSTDPDARPMPRLNRQ